MPLDDKCSARLELDVLVRGFSSELIAKLRSIVNRFAEGTVTAVQDRR